MYPLPSHPGVSAHGATGVDGISLNEAMWTAKTGTVSESSRKVLGESHG